MLDGLMVWPGTDVLANGFFVGSDSNGIYQAEGELDDIHTYNVVLDTNQVLRAYQWSEFGYMMNPYNFIGVAVEIVSSTNPYPSYNTPIYNAITGHGSLQGVGTRVQCHYQQVVWITNIVVAKGSERNHDHV